MGNAAVPKNLIFRLTLPVGPIGEFTPSAVFCDEAALSAADGIATCLKTAGVIAK